MPGQLLLGHRHPLSVRLVERAWSFLIFQLPADLAFSPLFIGVTLGKSFNFPEYVGFFICKTLIIRHT